MSITTLPGLIDIHVHLRDPGQTHKEDFYSGTSAALAGGFTMLADMPNNAVPITTAQLMQEKIDIAQKKIVCDVGFYLGSLGTNLDEFDKVSHTALGLKLYLDITTGGFIIDEAAVKNIYKAWSSSQPILLHSEEDKVQLIVNEVKKTGKKSHFCHVSSKHELEQIITAKEQGLPITCGVCPHHLFLSEDDVSSLGTFGRMKPYLKSKKDAEYLWRNINYVDVIESDHAPHTKEEKASDSPPFGVPGLETTLPLLMTAVDQKRFKETDILRLCYEGPKSILGLPEQKDTHIEVQKGTFVIDDKELHTKCGWSPFNGWKVSAKVKKVILRGNTVFENGTVLSHAGSGKILTI
jgi:carbamoyl-phosphate synthase/aspartate carbamoyltransferase/dihydroorotase